MKVTRTKFAHASISETGSRNGKAGDQTGREVKISPFYDFGQTTILRISDNDERHRVSKYAQAIVKNDNIGYSQADRYSFYEQLLKVSRICDVKKKCNTDCSQMIASIMLRMGYADFNKWTRTGTLEEDFKKCMERHNVKYKVIKYKNQEQLCKGDILLKPNKHVVVVL